MNTVRAAAAEGLSRSPCLRRRSRKPLYFARNHRIAGSSLDAVDQAFAAAVQVVEFALGHAVVHVGYRQVISISLRRKLFLMRRLTPVRSSLSDTPRMFLAIRL